MLPEMPTVFGWQMLVASVDFLCEKSTAGWLVLVLCEREILLAECSEDEANRVTVGGEVEGLVWQSRLN